MVFFLLKCPPEIDFTFGDLFVNNFYKEKQIGEMKDFTGFKECIINNDYEGYFDRPHDQWENFYIEKNNWRLIPKKVSELASLMSYSGISVLKSVFHYIGVNSIYWSKITEGLTENNGHQMMAFNHFRSEKKIRGCKFHRDSGWVTILRSTEPGLLAYIDGKLWAINPEPGYFIVNFGSSIEVLTEYMPLKVHANIHGVIRTNKNDNEKDRVSYALFLDSSLDGDIYRYGCDGPEKIQSVFEFAIQEVSRTYNDNNESL